MVSGHVKEIEIQVKNGNLGAFLEIPEQARGVIIFAHGSGSSRHSPRNRLVADFLHDARFATLLIDLLTPNEEAVDMQTRELRFDIPFLAKRLDEVTAWTQTDSRIKHLNIGYFGASTGAAAALVSAASNHKVKAVVSRGGRPDLAGSALEKVTAPTLLIVGGEDSGVIELNEKAFALLNCDKRMEIVPGATHLFEESGTLEQAATLAAKWFELWV